jgi:YidC/Oxa1 family membrane protein insertase
MFPPEVQRIVLLIGLAVTGYLLILAWNEDVMQPSAAVEHSAAPDIDDAPTTDFPEASIPAVASSSDIPDISLIGTDREPAISENVQASATNRLVRVTTPVLDVWIDRLGGDVRRVHLPKFPVELSSPDIPYELLNVGSGRTYIAQSGLIGPDGLDSGSDRPLFVTSQPNYELTGEGTLEVLFEAVHNNVDVQKKFVFTADEYLVDVSYRIQNRLNRPFEASLFAQIKRDGEDPEGDESSGFGPRPYVGGALTTPDSRYQKIEFEDLDEEDFRASVTGGWIAFLQHYFLSAWIANEDDANTYYGRKRSDGTYIVGYTTPMQTVSAGSSGEWQTRFYAGPKDQKRLEEIADNLNLTVDYGFLWWLAVPLFSLLDWLHELVGNWGAAIILLTVMVKLVLYPLSQASYKSMANMRRVQPQMKRLQERYADDRQKLSQEMMGLYKKEKVNPLGGCLPMLLPMPIFIALYWVLFESVELRQAPFMLWIDDLAAMDPFFVLPLLMGGSMFLQQMISPMAGDPMQVRMMKMMPIMFTVLFLFFPAGLVLYWLVNSVLSIAQQWYVIKRAEAAVPAKG